MVMRTGSVGRRALKDIEKKSEEIQETAAPHIHDFVLISDRRNYASGDKKATYLCKICGYKEDKA